MYYNRDLIIERLIFFPSKFFIFSSISSPFLSSLKNCLLRISFTSFLSHLANTHLGCGSICPWYSNTLYLRRFWLIDRVWCLTIGSRSIYVFSSQERRFAVLVSSLLSSQTKDHVTHGKSFSSFFKSAPSTNQFLDSFIVYIHWWCSAHAVEDFFYFLFFGAPTCN